MRKLVGANFILLALLLQVLFLPSTSLAQAPSSGPANFQFSQVDLKLLEEVNEFDHQLSKKGLVLKDPVVTAYVQSIGEELLGDQAPPERVEFKFRVLRDTTINAFALPNGSIYVNTGLLALLDNEGELASVLGHEITHVTNRHTYLFNRSVRKKMVVLDIFQAAGAASVYFPAGSAAATILAASSALGEIMIATTIFGYSQDMEREADRNGLDRMYRAGYDPHAMPRTFELLDERLEYEPVEGFYRSHPKLKERLATTQELAERIGGRDQRVGTEADYLDNTSTAICYNIRADLESRRARTALARAKKLTQWQPQESSYLVLEADSYRVLGAKTATPPPDELEKHGQSEHRKRYFKLTEDEEQKELLVKQGGEEQRHANFEKAEKYYRSAIQANGRFPDPHRGLGFLYQQEGRTADAVREYHRYLELAPPDALDRVRIERRLTVLEPGTTQAAQPAAKNF
jgi:predicted Zn-dependent protease